MALLVLTKKEEIEKAQNEFITTMKTYCDEQIPVKLGHQGDTIECTIYWSNRLGVWFHSRKIEGSRYWNAFGLAEVSPKPDSLLPIICEINPPIEGLNKRVQGAFVRDDNGRILLVHRGRIGGGRPGIGKKLFVEHYQGEKCNIDSDEIAVIGVINANDFPERVSAFVNEINRIKNIAS